MLQPHQIAILRASVAHVAPVDDAAWAELLPHVRLVYMAKGDYFLRAGEHAHAFGWVLRGIVRKYYTGANGREHVSAFSTESYPFGSLPDLLSGEPSKTSIDCLEDTEAAVLEWADFQEICARVPQWSNVLRVASGMLLQTKAQRESQLLTLDAEERYRLLLARAPEVAMRVPLYHLASYLGMRPEHLSRVRRKLSETPSSRPPSSRPPKKA